MSDDFNAAKKRLEGEWPIAGYGMSEVRADIRLLLDKVHEQAEEIERLKQEAKRVVAVAEAAPKQSYVIDLGEIAKQDAPKQAEQPDHELVELRRENERLHKNIDINLELLEKAEAALATERAQRESLEKLLLDIADDATDGPINRGLNSVQAVLAWTAAAAPECHCTGDGHKADCALWVSLAAPQESEPTPSVKRCDCPVPDCQHHRGLIPYPAAGSEQPDLPLGHEFVAGHPHPAYQSYCALRGIFGLCGQPESAHRRKP